MKTAPKITFDATATPSDINSSFFIKVMKSKAKL